MDQTTDYQQALIDEVRGLPEEAFPNLLQIVHLFKESVLFQRRQTALALHAELAEWDRLSDEALLEFEKGLKERMRIGDIYAVEFPPAVISHHWHVGRGTRV